MTLTARDAAFMKWNPACRPPAGPAPIGDDQAEELGRLLVKWAPLLRRECRRLLRYAYPFDRTATAADLAQEVAVLAARRFPAYRPDRGAFSTWLAMLAFTAAHDLRTAGAAKKRAGRPLGQARADGSDRLAGLPDPRAVPPPELLAEAEDRRRRVARLRGMLRVLTPRQRAALKRRFGLGPGGRPHTFRDVDPARSDEANRKAVELALARLREYLSRAG